MLRANVHAPKPGEVERVAAWLLERIVSGRFPAGLRLPSEVELAEQLACGRSTVREALGRLGTAGVVTSRRGSGALVLDWRERGSLALLPAYLASGLAPAEAPRLLVELLSMRRLLAREAVRLAATYAEPASLGGVRAALDRLEAAIDADEPRERTLAELELFRAFVVASGVWPAVWLANGFFDPLREASAMFAPLAGAPPADQCETMRKLAGLVEARRADDAEALVDRYFAKVDRELGRTLAAALGAEPAAPPPRDGSSPHVGSSRPVEARRPTARRTRSTDASSSGKKSK